MAAKDRLIRVLSGRKGGYTTSSRYPGREITTPALRGRHAARLRQVDPNNELTEAERERRAEALMRREMAAMRLAKEQKAADNKKAARIP